MPEQFRTRDCVIIRKGDTFTPNITERMASQGWVGGQIVSFASRGLDEILVDFSDGVMAGFLLWGSNESSDQYVAMTGQQPTYGYATAGCSGFTIMTIAYERYTWNSRNGIGPPNVPIVYEENDRLVPSLRGLWTKEDEWTLSGDPRAPNNYYMGFVAQSPRPYPPFNNYMTIQI